MRWYIEIHGPWLLDPDPHTLIKDFTLKSFRVKIRLALKNIFTSLTRVDAKIIIVVNCFTKRSIAAV